MFFLFSGLVVGKLGLIALVEILVFLLLSGFMLELCLLLLQALIQITNLIVQVFNLLAVINRVLCLITTSVSIIRGGWSLIVLNVACVQILPCPHHFLDFLPILLILHSLNIELAT